MNFIEKNCADSPRALSLNIQGKPYPEDYPGKTHAPCITSKGYESTTLATLNALDTTILGVGIDIDDSEAAEYFACIVEDFDTDYFGVSDFDDLGALVDDISSIVCSDDIVLVINEIGIIGNVTEDGDDLIFVELYNPSVGVSLDGFNFTGLISYTVDTTSAEVDQGQYWVISTYDMDTLNQTACRNCSQDFLINASYVDTSMDNSYFKLAIYQLDGELVDYVERNAVYFPFVSAMYTHELQYEDYDNSLGGNWEESCYEYGTPQETNQEDCPCNMLKCIEKGDILAYCGMCFVVISVTVNVYDSISYDGSLLGTISDSAGSTTTGCVCSDDYVCFVAV